MISADQALQIVLENVAPLGVERIPILDALGRVLAENISSSRDIPGFDNSAMDGYAVRAADLASASEANPVKLRVVETAGAGQMPSRRVGAGETVRTMTGAPIADGADAIIQVERTRGSGDVVEFLAPAEVRGFIRPRGEDLRLGELVMSPGKTLTPADLGMLASVNRAMVEVIRRPRVAIVATGDELVDVDQAPEGAQVVNSSAYALAGAVREAGAEAVILKVARDVAGEIRDRLAEAMTFDAVLSTGGVSVGQFDHVKGALDELGMRQLFHGVAQKPGRPLKFGTVGYRPIFGLPGNPVSTMVTFELFARPILEALAGVSPHQLTFLHARLKSEIRVKPGLKRFLPAILSGQYEDSQVEPVPWQGSGDIAARTRANCYIVIPPDKEHIPAAEWIAIMLR